MDLNKSLESLLPESDGVKMVITEDAQTLNTAARHSAGSEFAQFARWIGIVLANFAVSSL
jgi:hypothetical protein